ncbi:hypothetical protein VTJ04DRAFT_3836 [Mycothermus thermophilus]|uniref:uncharacterized protein n=1 Tax=Humicola insolens TaxID=85995 RepID=UPI0037426AED
MSSKPIFLATHPRALSTVFERIFMTRTDDLHCVHEPFGDAFYFGPERLSDRYENDEQARKDSGFADTTFADVMDSLLKPTNNGGKRLFIKDIAHYIFPPDGKPASIAPSLVNYNPPNSTTTNGNTDTTNGSSSSKIPNPTVIPLPLLRQFHFAFLIRHPRRAIPSYYRCTVPPLSARTGFHDFMPSEAGYSELRRLFDYLRAEGVIVDRDAAAAGGTNGVNGGTNGTSSTPNSNEAVKITLIDADDLLLHPIPILRQFCADIGIPFSPSMLSWGGDEEGQQRAVEAFAKWDGFHDDAIHSTELRPTTREGKEKKDKVTEEEEDREWSEKYGEEAARVIRRCVQECLGDYEYLKGFALKVEE